MTILFITEIAPLPINGGEKLRCISLLQLMSALQHNVHAITSAFSTDSLPASLNNIRFYPFDFTGIKSIKRIKRYRSLFSLNKKLTEVITRVIQNNKIDVAFIDYSFYGQYINIFRNKKIPVIYGTHNAQALLINQYPASSIKDRIIKITDYLMYRLHEVYYFRKADALIVVSENDKKYHTNFAKKDKIFIIPNFLIESDYHVVSQKKKNYILMTANFNAFQNAIGLEWFLSKVWDDELKNKTSLFIAGRGSPVIYNILKEKFDLTNVILIGEVEDLKSYISEARVSIVPLLHGSGSRLKCLEAMALRTNLLSTTKGAEGIDHNNSITVADTPNNFKNNLLSIIEGKINKTEKAYQSFLAKYSLEPNKLIFKNIIDIITKSEKL